MSWATIFSAVKETILSGVQQWLPYDVHPPDTELGSLWPVQSVVVCWAVSAVPTTKLTQILGKPPCRPIRVAIILKLSRTFQLYYSYLKASSKILTLLSYSLSCTESSLCYVTAQFWDSWTSCRWKGVNEVRGNFCCLEETGHIVAEAKSILTGKKPENRGDAFSDLYLAQFHLINSTAWVLMSKDRYWTLWDPAIWPGRLGLLELR